MLELYSLATGQWQAVTPLSPIETCPESFCNVVTDRPIDVGSQWVEFRQSDCPMGEHCTGSNVFQNLYTNQISSDPTGGQTIADLNSPSLARRVCRPVRVPAPAIEEPTGLTMYGSFAVAQNVTANGAPMSYLERCGSTLHEVLARLRSPEPRSRWQPTHGR